MTISCPQLKWELRLTMPCDSRSCGFERKPKYLPSAVQNVDAIQTLHIKYTLHYLDNEYVCALYQAVLGFLMLYGVVLLIVLIFIYFT